MGGGGRCLCLFCSSTYRVNTFFLIFFIKWTCILHNISLWKPIESQFQQATGILLIHIPACCWQYNLINKSVVVPGYCDLSTCHTDWLKSALDLHHQGPIYTSLCYRSETLFNHWFSFLNRKATGCCAGCASCPKSGESYPFVYGHLSNWNNNFRSYQFRVLISIWFVAVGEIHTVRWERTVYCIVNIR